MAASAFYLRTPPALEPDSFAGRLAEVLDTPLAAGAVEAVLLCRASLPEDDAAARAAIDRLRPIAQDRGVAFLLEDRPDLAATTGCDGVESSAQGPGYRACRKAVGDGASVGIACGSSRHDAMVAGEAGADYIAFGPVHADGEEALAEALDLIAWWAEMMELPSVALGPVDAATAPRYAAAGADFLALDQAVWDHPDGPAAGLAAIAAAVARTEAAGGS